MQKNLHYNLDVNLGFKMSNIIHIVPECCRFLLLPFPANGIMCFSWLSLSSTVASLTL